MLQRLQLALCDGGQAPKFTVAIGGTADAEGRAAMGTLDAIDPERSLAEPQSAVHILPSRLEAGDERER